MSVPARGSRRQEGREKVTGATRFTADLEHAGLLHVHLVLAHTASARIRGIETGRARSSPGVVDVVTARDLPELDSAGPDLPLALERVFYVGQPVVAVVPEPDGGLTIWSSTQGPFVIRDSVAALVDLPPHKVRVVPMAVGGGFGGKIELLEPLLALLALRLRRPVRLSLVRSHEFVVGHPAPAAQFALELGARQDGTLVALRARYHYDNGATAGWHAGLTANFLGGTYRIPSFDIRGLEVATNKTPADAYRAPGATQAYFALESAIDELAVRLQIDPIELRLRNVSREGDPT